MTYFNAKFKNKVYILEFLNGTQLEASFGFSVPPQSEDFNFPQRIGETKTFGGSVFEDYGNDTGKITLSGSTINSEIRMLFSKGSSEVVRGEDEIFKLNNLIKTYGKKDKLSSKKIELYSLDSSYKSWNVIINELSIKRSKENPLAYSYTLTCTSYDDRKLSIDGAFAFIKIINDIISAIKKPLDTMENWLSNYRKGLDYIKSIRKALADFEDALQSYSQIASGFLDATAEYIKETQLLVSETATSPGRIILNAERTLFNSALSLNETCVDFWKYIKDFDEREIYQELLDRANSTATELKEAWNIESDDMISASETIVKEVSRSSSQNSLAVDPGNSKTSDEVIPIYGYMTQTVSDADTWDGLALKYYNDTSYSKILATYNLSQGIDLVMGNKIKIPIINQAKSMNVNNLIYAEPEKLDNYGIDIQLDNDGNLDTLRGDFSLVSESRNLSQAINNRLCTTLNSRIRLNVYGIKTIIGGTDIANAYIISSIEKTMMQDPRVKSIEGIAFKGMGDVITVSVTYTDINGEKQIYGGRI